MGGVGTSHGAMRQPGLVPYLALEFVMAGLDPAIHVFLFRGPKDVDARDKPGHDEDL
jgi:hypothetical protein